jgi:protein-S-isoprenylcysteine O-methyltransferase Ste14
MQGDPTAGADRRAYLFALAPGVVVLAVAPALGSLPGAGLGVALEPLRLLGPPLVLGGLVLAGWSVHSFVQAGEPGRLVTRGALAYTRNPLYLGTAVAADEVSRSMRWSLSAARRCCGSSINKNSASTTGHRARG